MYPDGQIRGIPTAFLTKFDSTVDVVSDVAEDLFRTDAWLSWASVSGLMVIFWEAHEVIEPVWIALSRIEKRCSGKLAQAVIQLANAELKKRMQRPTAVISDFVDHVEAAPCLRVPTERVAGCSRS